MPSIYAKDGLRFDGKTHDLLPFLEEFEILADGCRLTSSEMARQLCKYTSPAVRNLWEVLQGYKETDYDILKKNILDCYPEAQETRKYSPQDLEEIVDEYSERPLRSESDLADYYRAFKAVALGLLSQGDLSTTEVNKAFWFGLHDVTRDRIERKLEVAKPDHDDSRPWAMEEVFVIGKKALSSRAFDATLRDRREKFRVSNAIVRRSDDRGRSETKGETRSKVVRFGEEEESFEEIVRKMSTLKVNEPTYALLYTKLAMTAPTALSIWPKPSALTAAAASHSPAPATRTPWSAQRPDNYNMCHFCSAPGCRVHFCPTAADYAQRGIIRKENDGTYRYPGGDWVTREGLKNMREAVERRLQGQKPSQTATTNAMREPPPHMASTMILEFAEGLTGAQSAEKRDSKAEISEDEHLDRLQAVLNSWAMERRAKATQKPGGTEPSAKPTTPAAYTPTTTGAANPNAYHLTSDAENAKVIDAVFQEMLDGKCPLPPRTVLALSQDVRRKMNDYVRVRRVDGPKDAAAVQLLGEIKGELAQQVFEVGMNMAPQPEYSLPLREVEMELNGKIRVAGILDSGSQITLMTKRIWEATRAPLNPGRRMPMQDANGGLKSTMGVVENLAITVGDVTTRAHVHVVENAPFDLLIGRPWFQAVRSALIDEAGGVVLEFEDPAQPGRRMVIPTTERKGKPSAMDTHFFESIRTHVPASMNKCVEVLSLLSSCAYDSDSAPVSRTAYLRTPPKGQEREDRTLSRKDRNTAAASRIPTIVWGRTHTVPGLLEQTHQYDEIQKILAYKKVAHKVRPVATTSPETARPVRRFPEDPLASLPEISDHPPEFRPTTKLTMDRINALGILTAEFLWPEERKLVLQCLTKNEKALAWDESEKGKFREDYFEAVKIPTIEHTPWAKRNIPIPPGIADDISAIIRDKVASGVYEPSNSSYRSPWFTVKKKDGALRIVHSLTDLNAVTVKDASLPPVVEQFAEKFAGRGVYSMMDLFVGYDHRVLDLQSRNLTTFQTPMGAMRLTSLPMGWTNSVQVFQGDVAFILQDEYKICSNFVDDVPVMGPASRYETGGGTFETIPGNPGIRRFIWEHVVDVNRIMHRIGHAGGTISGKKLFIAVPEVTIVGHRCTYDGRVPEEGKVDKIRNWPRCDNVSEVRGFLGTCGVVRVFIKDFAAIARPLVQLTKKDEDFTWEAKHDDAMFKLKAAVCSAPALRPIDYRSQKPVVVSVDSSYIAVGFILSQEDGNGRRRPARYGSITWNEREARYSQAKIELYGLFRALKNLRVYIIGVSKLVVEVDASYIKGMLNNPDIQPNAAMNRWIVGILQFDFELRHVPGKLFGGPDGLSRRKRAEGDQEDDGAEAEEWVDEILGLGIWIAHWMTGELKRAARSGQIWRSTGTSGPTSAAITEIFDLEAQERGVPKGEKTDRLDEELRATHDYLTTLRRPTHLKDKALASFFKRASLFFVRGDKLWRRNANGQHQLVIYYNDRLPLLQRAHDDLGHKGTYATAKVLSDRFWWPALHTDTKWFCDTCHECQLRTMRKVINPPTISTPAPLFFKVFLDTMLMPKHGGFSYVTEGRCSLVGYVEGRALRTETGETLGRFIFEEFLCRWGAVAEIVTDNGTAYVAALDWLSEKYHINHIRISPYNSRANGIAERTHRTVREALVKACNGEIARWPKMLPYVLWADRVTTRKATGMSPFYMAHGVEPLLPFDVTEATYLIPDLDSPMTTAELIAVRARQLEKREEDLARIRDRIMAARQQSVAQFEKEHAHTMHDYNFKPGALVLVRNTKIESDLGRKCKPRYLGPLVVVRRTQGGAYVLAELDGAISRLRFAAFRLIPYRARSRTAIPVTEFVDAADLGGIEMED